MTISHGNWGSCQGGRPSAGSDEAPEHRLLYCDQVQSVCSKSSTNSVLYELISIRQSNYQQAIVTAKKNLLCSPQHSQPTATAVLPRTATRRVYACMCLQDLENTTGSWDMYGQDSDKRYPGMQAEFFERSGDILKRREALRGFVALCECAHIQCSSSSDSDGNNNSSDSNRSSSGDVNRAALPQLQDGQLRTCTHRLTHLAFPKQTAGWSDLCAMVYM